MHGIPPVLLLRVVEEGTYVSGRLSILKIWYPWHLAFKYISTYAMYHPTYHVELFLNE